MTCSIFTNHRAEPGHVTTTGLSAGKRPGPDTSGMPCALAGLIPLCHQLLLCLLPRTWHSTTQKCAEGIFLFNQKVKASVSLPSTRPFLFHTAMTGRTLGMCERRHEKGNGPLQVNFDQLTRDKSILVSPNLFQFAGNSWFWNLERTLSVVPRAGCTMAWTHIKCPCCPGCLWFFLASWWRF